jgi:hypothetical protein
MNKKFYQSMNTWFNGRTACHHLNNERLFQPFINFCFAQTIKSFIWRIFSLCEKKAEKVNTNESNTNLLTKKNESIVH